MGIILSSDEDFNQIRGILGFTDQNSGGATNEIIGGFVYLGQAESYIYYKVTEQIPNGVASVEDIMVLSDVVALPNPNFDKINLKAATALLTAAYIAPAIPNIVNTSASSDMQAVSFGGIGNAWKEMADRIRNSVQLPLSRIRNWTIAEEQVSYMSGPTRAAKANGRLVTLSGFYPYGRTY